VAEETAKLMSDTSMRLDPAEWRLLAAMPQHAITSVHGEAGRPTGTAGNRNRRFPPADRGRAADALTLASRLQAADRRQSDPYANHLLRVTQSGYPATPRTAVRRLNPLCQDFPERVHGLVVQILDVERAQQHRRDLCVRHGVRCPQRRAEDPPDPALSPA
jgi:hypothetical protein